jgi:hypothetical protein
MKKIRLVLLWCLLVGTIASCSKKDDEEPQPATTASNDYFPTTAKSSWEYGGDDPYKGSVSGATKVIDGKTYFELETTRGTDVQKSYLRKENGAYWALGMMNSESIEMVVLKDNVPVGNSWEYRIPFDQMELEGLTEEDKQALEIFEGLETKIKYTIAEKDITKTVEGKSYNKVIHVKYDASVTFFGQDMPLATSHYYFAKGIGLILSDLGEYGQYPLLKYDIK